mmetsp:Transcript_10696/g.24834  ORF Transcript_10696/g.24834 Transcript_10696/m.24834 type:complete len:101 (+) Transcript_10696:801-1103(+)
MAAVNDPWWSASQDVHGRACGACGACAVCARAWVYKPPRPIRVQAADRSLVFQLVSTLRFSLVLEAKPSCGGVGDGTVKGTVHNVLMPSSHFLGEHHAHP